MKINKGDKVLIDMEKARDEAEIYLEDHPSEYEKLPADVEWAEIVDEDFAYYDDRCVITFIREITSLEFWIYHSHILGKECRQHDAGLVYHDTEEKWVCPFCYDND